MRALVFDLDGTLVDDRAFATAARETAEEVTRGLPGVAGDELAAAFTAALAELSAEIGDGLVTGRWNGRSFLAEGWGRALGACGAHDPALTRRAVERHWDGGLVALDLYEAAVPCLRWARERMEHVALVTNGSSDMQWGKLDALGLARWFDRVVVSGEHGVAKPDPAVFTPALDGCPTARAGIWYVGDSLAHDIAGARAAGIGAVWVNRHGRSLANDDPVPDVEIASLDELPDALGGE